VNVRTIGRDTQVSRVEPILGAVADAFPAG
jgi:hypothetical protein